MTTTIEQISIQEAREQWLKQRRAGIGGSDAASILGVSPYKSALELFTEKIGLYDDEEFDIPEWVQIGAELEEFIARRYMKQTKRTVTVATIDDPARFVIRRHPTLAFMICTLDGVISPIDDRGPGVLELKNVIGFKESDWSDEPPLHYQIQIQHNMVVTGMKWGSFGVFFGGNKVREYDVDLNPRFAEALVREETAFWHRVESGEAPLADGSDSATDALMRLFPNDTGVTIDLPEEVVPMRDRLRLLKSQMKEAGEEASIIKNQIKQMIGDATIGRFPDGSGFSLKTVNNPGYTVDASSFRPLREINKPTDKRGRKR